MGCCCSLPDLQNDPSVAYSTEVGDISIFRGISTVQVRGCCKGLMYVQDNSLIYLCCRCCERRFELTQIEEIEVIYNQTVYPSSAPILLSWLKLTISPNVTVMVTMPDAVNFARLLAQSSGNQEVEGAATLKEGRAGSIVYSKKIHAGF